MTLDEITKRGIMPAMALLPPKMNSKEALVMLLSIGLQESRFQYRRQMVGSPPRPIGPAKSFWQAEQGGGMVAGVRTHAATKASAEVLYRELGIPRENRAIWDAIEHDDVLAAGLARLLLYSDTKPLPALGDVQGAWDLYNRVWRPGKPHRATWDALYQQALDYVKARA